MTSLQEDLAAFPAFAGIVEQAKEHQNRERVQDGGTSPQVVLHHTSDSGMARFIHVDQGQEADYATDEWTIVAAIGFDGEVRIKGDGDSTPWRPRAQETPQNGSGVVQGRREQFNA